MSTIRNDEYQMMCRHDLYTFVHRSFLELNPGTEFVENWHTQLLASKLSECVEGSVKRFIANLPPRSLKSHCVSVALPAFILGHRPTAQIICVSYGQDLANKLSSDCRTLMSSAWYQGIFPTRLSPQKHSVQEFASTQGGFRLATSIGGVLTGRGADYILIDDPLKPDEALSNSRRGQVNDWFDHSLYSRLNDKKASRVVVVMQRLHQDDLVAHVLEQEAWDILCLPAIGEQNESHRITTLFGTRIVNRRMGEALDPDREPMEVLERIRQTIGEYNFASQYQQRPAPAGGGIVKAKWFKTYRSDRLPTQFDRIIQSWDTANKSSDLNDYSVGTTWGVVGQRMYLLDVYRFRLEYPDLRRVVKEQARLYRASVVLIEDRASGTALIQDLIRDGVAGVTKYDPRGQDKIVRMHSATSKIEGGLVYLPESAKWLDTYLTELCTFPYAKYDDQADSTSQALDWAKRNILRYTLTEYYEQQAIKAGRVDPRLLSNLADEDPPILPRCVHCLKFGPGQYSRTYHCNDCQREWPVDEPQPEVPQCKTADGIFLEWNAWKQLWVDPETRVTYKPSDPEDPEGKT